MINRSDSLDHPIVRECGNAWPADGLESVSECPICRRGGRVVVHEGLTDTVFCCAPGCWTLYRCKSCGSCYLDPRPTEATLHLAYKRYFTHADGRSSAGGDTLSLSSKLHRILANSYCNWRHGTRLEPSSKLALAAALLLPPTLRGLLRHLPRIPGGGRLLDVGAGNGAYLYKVREVGWDVAGVEPDPEALAMAQRAGLNVRRGGIECFASEPESFDFITMSHVIEHVPDPKAVLSQAMTLLKARGSLFLETPNVQSYGHRRFGRHWRGLEPPRHLALFHWKSLERLLRQSGFSRIKRLPQINVYPGLAAKSRAISQGRDPEAHPEPTFMDRLTGAALDAGAMVNCRHSEFITLMAFKG